MVSIPFLDSITANALALDYTNEFIIADGFIKHWYIIKGLLGFKKPLTPILNIFKELLK